MYSQGFLKVEEQGKTVREVRMEVGSDTAVFEDSGRRPQAKECGWPLESGKGFSLSIFGRNSALVTP